MTKEDSALIRGLEGVVASETRLGDLDGKNGRLAYGGYDIDELARKATFEEVTYLLLYGELPKAARLDGLTVALTAAREIPRELVQAFRLMPKQTDPMRVLQAAVAMLGMSDPDATDDSHAANVRKATFEEVTYLLLYGELPKAARLDGLTVALTAAREIPRELVQAFRLMPKQTDPMRVLQAAVAMLGMSDPDATDDSHAANVRK